MYVKKYNRKRMVVVVYIYSADLQIKSFGLKHLKKTLRSLLIYLIITI